MAGAGGGGGPGPRRGSRGQSSLRTELMKKVAGGPPPQVPVFRTPRFLLEGSLDPRQQAVWFPGPVPSPGWCSHGGGRLCVCTGGRRGHLEGSRHRRGRRALVAPGVPEGGVHSQHGAAACRVRALLGRAGAGPRRFCGRHQVERPVGEAGGVASPAAFRLAAQDLWLRPGGALPSPVGQVSLSSAPREGPRPGGLALGPRAPWAPPQPIHLGLHGGHLLRQACQGRGQLVQLLREGDTEAVELLLQETPTGTWRPRGGGRPSWRDSGCGRRLRRAPGKRPPSGPGCNTWSSMSRPQAPRFFTNPGLPGQGSRC